MSTSHAMKVNVAHRWMSVSRSDVYFAFPDGKLAYDCHVCGAECCKGHGYSLTQIEARTQVARKPALEYFLAAESADPAMFAAKNCPPGCFFLTSDNLCGIQVQSGYQAKPETCRLFPFNDVQAVGDRLIVMPHVELCPLQLLAPGESNEGSRHDTLYEGMRDQGVSDQVPRVTPVGADSSALLQLEAAIRDLADEDFARSGYIGYAAKQLEVTNNVVASFVEPPIEPIATELASFVARVHAVMGLPVHDGSADKPQLTRAMALMTPTLRARLVFRNPAAPMVGPAVDLKSVPRFLLALSLWVRLAHDAGMRDVTYQTISRLFRRVYPTLALLAAVDRRVCLTRDALVDLRFKGSRQQRSRYVRILKALSRSGIGGTEFLTLGDVLEDNLSSDVVERTAMLDLIARRAGRSIVPVGARGNRRQTVRSFIAQATMRRLSPEFLIRVSEVISSRRTTAPTATTLPSHAAGRSHSSPA